MALVESGKAHGHPTLRPFPRWLFWLLGGTLGLLLLVVSAFRIYEVMTYMMVVGDDFRHVWNGALAIASGQTPYGWLAENRPHEAIDYIYPPLLALLLAPVTRVLDYPTTRWAWLGLNLVCLIVGCVLVWRVSRLQASGPVALALLSFVALIPSITVALALGQLSPVLFVCIAAIFAALQARRPASAGAAVAFAAYLKAFPGLLGGYLLLRGYWRAAVAAVVTGLLLVGWTVLALGWETLWVYLTQAVPAQHRWLGTPWNISLMGFLVLLLGDYPAILRVAITLTTLLVLAASAYAVWRAPRTSEGEAVAYALAVVVCLLMSPINGQYNFVILVLPLAVATTRVQVAWPRHLRWLLLIMVLLVQRYEVCELWPLQDWCNSHFTRGEVSWRPGWAYLLIEGPFYGLVALWGLLLRLCLEPPAAHVRQAE